MQEASTFDIKNQNILDETQCIWVDSAQKKASDAIREINHQRYRLEKQRLRPTAIYISRNLAIAILHQHFSHLHIVSHDEFTIFGIPVYQVLHDNHIRVVYET